MQTAAETTIETSLVSRTELAALNDRIAQLERENRLLLEKLHYLTQQRFGRKSEVIAPGQGNLFGLEPAAVEAEEQAPGETETKTRRRGGRRKPAKDLPRERIVHELPESQRHCRCGACLQAIGEAVSEQYDVIPPVFRILEHVQLKYACPACDQAGVVTAPKPAQPLPRHQVSPGLLAWLATSKFADGLPAHRQADRLKQRFGVAFTSTTLSQWLIKTAQLWLLPLLASWEPVLRASPYLQADETTLQVLDEPDRYPWQKSYLWLRRSASGPPILIFTYQPSRAGRVAEALFEGFSGYLQVDGYSGYNLVAARPEVIPLGCWAHARRKFDAVIKANGRRSPEAALAREVLGLIARMYRIEREIKDACDEQRRLRRERDTQPLFGQIRAWLDANVERAADYGGSLKTACTYLHNQWERLIVFATDPRLHPDNNRAEQHMRPIAQGRKNWLFAKSPQGAEATAAWYSVIETAKANGLEPYHYLRWLLDELPRHAAAGAIDWDAFHPWNLTPEQIGQFESRRG